MSAFLPPGPVFLSSNPKLPRPPSIIESRQGDSRVRELHTLRDLADQSPDFWNEPSVTSQPHETSSPEDYSSLCPQNSAQVDFDLLGQIPPFARQVFSLFSWQCSLLEQPQTAARGSATELPRSSSCYLRQFVLRYPLFLELILAHLICLTISTKNQHTLFIFTKADSDVIWGKQTLSFTSATPLGHPGFILSRTDFNDLPKTQYGGPSLAQMDRAQMLRSLLFWVPQEDMVPSFVPSKEMVVVFLSLGANYRTHTWRKGKKRRTLLYYPISLSTI